MYNMCTYKFDNIIIDLMNYLTLVSLISVKKEKKHNCKSFKSI